ncbi:phosphoribosylaminoimidazolesuccinocarboxamide synthase [Methylophilaceae bacterium]|nr:phosphoribosylaminoimidazolesuccinocarboxamide synthase [Methylophilaceae bacterium]
MALLETNLKSLPLLHQGKVRDIYDIDDEKMLIVTTDRLSAFDVIMTKPIPNKGRVLNQMANFWFNKLSDIVSNHLLDDDPKNYVSEDEVQKIKGRSVVVKKLKPILIEAIVRGYLAGSSWKEYQHKGMVCGISLPRNLQQASKLETPIFTPSSKAKAGERDENISLAECDALIGKELAGKIAQISLSLYQIASDHAESKGIIIADTKFEFGLDVNSKIYLIDEVLTPDSSRFWPKEKYQLGISPPSYDKQYVRDWLESTEWDKSTPAPVLPDEVITNTADKYLEAYTRLTSKAL